MSNSRRKIQAARVYDASDTSNCFRVLVDRLWPRGVRKEDLQIDAWWKEIAPSEQLRQWFNHDPDRWSEFRKRYFTELDNHRKTLSELLEAAGDQPILLLYAAKDARYNNAIALKEYLTEST
ncbi:MAG: DUF488 family protein [Fuerstiella sp.]